MATKLGDLQLVKTDRVIIGPNGATVSILIIDQSTSMDQFGSAPQEAAMAHVRALQDATDGKEHHVAVVGFSDQPRICLPLQNVHDIDSIDRLIPGGNTLLYKTVFIVLDDVYEIIKRLSNEERNKIKVVIAVISDGQDNRSDRNSYPDKLKRFVQFKAPRVWDLLTYGIGISGKRLAAAMGFPTDDEHAFDMDASADSFSEASSIITEHTTIAL